MLFVHQIPNYIHITTLPAKHFIKNVKSYDKSVIVASDRVDTSIWMHYMDANLMVGEKSWRQLHKNSASNIEQVQEAAPHKAAAVRPPIAKLDGPDMRPACLVRLTLIVFVMDGRWPNSCCFVGCWRSRDELIRDVLQWTPTHGRAKARREARTYIQQLCKNTECSEGWRERVRDIRADDTRWW